MGSPRSEKMRREDESQHVVRLTRPVLLADREVTQGLWKAVMGENPTALRSEYWIGQVREPCAQWGVGDDLPVTCVSWNDAVAFCNTLSELEGIESAYEVVGDRVTWKTDAPGYRLPTEAEWEYAARAGGKHLRYAGTEEPSQACAFGNVSNPSTKAKYAWFTWDTFPCADGYDGLAPVARFAPNAWGLYDMTGNVGEWTWDVYGFYGGTEKDPRGPEDGDARVFRGASWASPNNFTSSTRCHDLPKNRGGDLGLRLARNGDGP